MHLEGGHSSVSTSMQEPLGENYLTCKITFKGLVPLKNKGTEHGSAIDLNGFISNPVVAERTHCCFYRKGPSHSSSLPVALGHFGFQSHINMMELKTNHYHSFRNHSSDASITPYESCQVFIPLGKRTFCLVCFLQPADSSGDVIVLASFYTDLQWLSWDSSNV